MYKNVAFAYPWMDAKENVATYNTVVDKSNKPSRDALDRWKADIDVINKDDELFCPRRADGSIASDIDTVMSSNNPVLQNMIFGGMHAQPVFQQNQSLSDAQKIAQVLPRNSIIADVADQAKAASDIYDESVAQAAASRAAPVVVDPPKESSVNTQPTDVPPSNT